MADINHVHAPTGPTEGDGINYRGIFWMAVVLAVTTVASQIFIYGVLHFLQARADQDDAARSPMAAVAGQPPPPPNLLTNEPLNLESFRANEDKVLDTYGWMDQNAGVVRIPVDRAKELLLERGFPGGSPMTTTAAPGTAPTAPVEPAKAPAKPGKIIK